MNTLEDLIVDDIRTKVLVDENTEFDFESTILELCQIQQESYDLDCDINTLDLACECANEVEVTQEATSGIGQKLKEIAKKIIMVITRLCIFIYKVIQAPFTFIQNLIHSGSFKKAAKIVKFDIKGADAATQQIMESVMKMTPSAKIIKKRAELMDEFIKFQMDFITNGKKIYLDPISIYFFTDASNEFKNKYSETHNGSEYSGDSTAYDKTEDDFERKQKEFDKNYQDIINGKTNCANDQELYDTLTEAEKMKKIVDADGVINETQSQVRIIEKMVNGKDWDKIPQDKQQKIIGYLNHLKSLLNSLSIMSADQAKDVKAIYESTNKIIKIVENK